MLAWGTVKDDFAFGGSANTTVFPVALQPGPFLSGGPPFTKTELGWTAGAGVETKMAASWSAKLEYLHVDFGTVTETFAIPINPALPVAFTGGAATAARSVAHHGQHRAGRVELPLLAVRDESGGGGQLAGEGPPACAGIGLDWPLCGHQCRRRHRRQFGRAERVVCLASFRHQWPAEHG